MTVEAADRKLDSSPTRDRKVVRRWKLPGTPHGLAVTKSGVVYAGLAETQSVVAIDPARGVVIKEIVLDSAENASTKELISVRLSRDESRLIIAQGTDESVTILSIPSLEIIREIGIEGEVVRDAIPDPQSRYLYVLGRSVHVYDFAGEHRIRSLSDIAPMAIATDSTGSLLAVVGSEDYDNGPATVVALYDVATLREIGRQPLQTERRIDAALFAADDRALVVAAADWFAEKTLKQRPTKSVLGEPGSLKIQFEFGDFPNSRRICLPDNAGPQIIALGSASSIVVFGEKRCSSAESFSASKPLVTPASLYGVNAHSIAFDASTGSVFATDPSGTLTQYREPTKE